MKNYLRLPTRFLAGTGLTLALVMTAAVPLAHAESPNILVGSDLTVGSTGQNVVMLQGLLSELGYLNVPIGVPLGYFGSLTRTALAQYQASQGVSPAVGYFGPLTKIAMHAQFSMRGWLNLLGW